MSKIGLIIGREYKTRVRKKSFIVMTILGPILFAALMISPAILMRLEDDDYKKIAVIDETREFDGSSLRDTKSIGFDFVSEKYWDGTQYDLAKAKKDMKDNDYYALLYIPASTTISANRGAVQLYSYQQPNMGLKMHISNGVEKKIEEIKLSIKADSLKIDKQEIDNILMVAHTSIDVKTTTIQDDGSEKESSTTVAMIIGYICGFLIYMFIFMYGSMVMNGVIEEKSNRIVEVIVSSVKPFQLMLGKIIGVALVGITQFVLWVMMTFGIVTAVYSIIGKDYATANLTPQNEITGSSLTEVNDVNTDDMAKLNEIKTSLNSINYAVLLSMFLFYFIGGYLLYAAMFAIAGSAVDNETDTQQFTLPITVPLILGIFVMLTTINNPNGNLAYWFSIIPFTSPIVMMVRIPFFGDVLPISDILISMSLLIVTFIAMTWLAAKIYRVGILMYGKKTNYKELWKWLRYRN